MDAKQARFITEQNLSGPVIERYVANIEGRIANAAREGKSKILNPQHGSVKTGLEYMLSGAEREAVRKHFESKGFTWKDFPDPDPGHPCSAPYTELSW